MKNTKWFIKVLIIVSMSIIIVGCSGTKNQEISDSFDPEDPMTYGGRINIAAQTVNETIVLAHMAKLMIEEHSSLNTTINTDFQGAAVLHQAMLGGEIAIYPSWTGVQLFGILEYDGPNLSSTESFEMVKEGFEERFNMTWAKPLGFNNTYAMTVRRDTAEEINLSKASDLKPYAANMILAGDTNFDISPDAYPGWSSHYGIEFKNILTMQYALMYQAINQYEVDVIGAYSTDSRIKKMDLVMLEDDLEFFPDYSACYVVDMDMLEKYPKVLEILEMLSGTITEEDMVALNYEYDEGGNPEKIAREYLRAKGFIK